jgi:hypothetical protein
VCSRTYEYRTGVPEIFPRQLHAAAHLRVSALHPELDPQQAFVQVQPRQTRLRHKGTYHFARSVPPIKAGEEASLGTQALIDD